MIAHLRLLMAVGLASLAVACMTQQPVTFSNAVGPDPTVDQTPSTSNGFLTVYTTTYSYSASDIYPLYDMTYYRVHTDYDLYDASGRLLKNISNASTYHGPNPQVVALSPGRYTVAGLADGDQLVKVPVVIAPGRTTVVNLEANKNKHFQGAKDSDVVRASDGRIIGWSASPM
jgi:hypothetical protein